MVVKKSHIIAIALLLGLAASPISGTLANDGNNLVQLDLKKSSNNSVNVTLFTSNGYNDNVLVRKKSDNKYVILIPKVQSSGYSASNLSGVNDLVSNVDVKTVNDTNGGYTKVTLITTKPLNITTRAQKSAPVTEEQKEYRTLIAQANSIKNNIGKQSPQNSAKTEVTVNKPQVKPQVKQPAKPAVKTEAPKPEVKKPDIFKNVEKTVEKKMNTVKKQPVNTLDLTEVTPQKIDRMNRKSHLQELIQEVKQEKALEAAPQKAPQQEVRTVAGTTYKEPVKDIQELPRSQAKESFWNSLFKSGLPKKIGIGFASLIGLMMFINLVKAVFAKTQEYRTGYVDNLSGHQPVVNTVKYNNIVNDDELSWREKYQRYLDESAKPVPRANNKGNYTFIKTPAPKKQFDKKRKDLEKMMNDVASVNDTQNLSADNDINVKSEDAAIHKTIKLKAFKHKASLDVSSRDKIRSRFKKYEVEIPLQEQKNIDLGNSILHSNPRRLRDANLNVSDVDGRGRRMTFKPQEYIMSSVDEFFSIMDKEKQSEIKKVQPNISVNNTTNPISKKTVNTPSQQVKPVIHNNPISQTNPISKLRNDTKASYINGLIIKSGFNLDEHKGFYVVNLDGKSALIGRINDEIFVLKKFDGNVDTPVQVRHDNDNVYMVKAGGFKSLVEVDENKMGVLIEL